MDDFQTHAKKMEFVYNKIKQGLNPESLSYLMDTRAYFHDEQRKLFTDLQIFQCIGLPQLTEAEKAIFTEMGCFSENGYFLLENRFIIPVYSASGKLITLIGWYNDDRKYITLPTPYFSKKVDWFNLDHALKLSFEKFNGLIYVVEGIFDTYSLRSIGLPAIGTMGADISMSKGELLKIFNKQVAIPDNDKTGKKAIRSNNAWHLPYNGTYLELRGKVRFDENNEYRIKDVDNLISWFDVDSVRNMLLQVGQSKDKYEIISL